jgi:CubicO group peptidase (beta-lactamase class C family)
MVSVAAAAPDESLLGRAWGYPSGNTTTAFQESYRVGSFSAMASIFNSRRVDRAHVAAPLPRGEPAEIRYTSGGVSLSVQDYLDRNRVTGLLILHDGRIVHEQYQYGRHERHAFISFSMAKSLTASLVGIAVDRGHLRSLDDPAETYVPELKGSAYGTTTLRQLLRMSSGVRFSEEYSGTDDMGRLWDAMFRFGERPLPLLSRFEVREAGAGTRFRYATAETQVLCYVLTRATGKPVAALTQEWIWQPLGAEADAAWLVGRDDLEFCGGGFNATLRDYGRLGQLWLDGGRRGDHALIPVEFLADATRGERQPEGFRPGQPGPFGYGYQFWISQRVPGAFSAIGVYGQMIFVHPETRVVVVQTAAWRSASSRDAAAERSAFVEGVMRSLARR